MTARYRSLVLVAVLAASVAAQADDTAFQVVQAWARRAPVMETSLTTIGRGNGAVYVTFVNTGKDTDTLTGAASEAASAVEIHESYQDMGMTMMRPVGSIDVAPGQQLEMKPGGYHLMLLDLKRGLEAGQEIRVTLQFRRAGKIDMTAEVR